MKYLFLIIRHIFPRKRWKIIKVISTYDTDDYGRVIGTLPIYRKITLQDQFGNVKYKKI